MAARGSASAANSAANADTGAYLGHVMAALPLPRSAQQTVCFQGHEMFERALLPVCIRLWLGKSVL